MRTMYPLTLRFYKLLAEGHVVSDSPVNDGDDHVCWTDISSGVGSSSDHAAMTRRHLKKTGSSFVVLVERKLVTLDDRRTVASFYRLGQVTAIDRPVQVQLGLFD